MLSTSGGEVMVRDNNNDKILYYSILDPWNVSSVRQGENLSLTKFNVSTNQICFFLALTVTDLLCLILENGTHSNFY